MKSSLNTKKMRVIDGLTWILFSSLEHPNIIYSICWLTITPSKQEVKIPLNTCYDKCIQITLAQMTNNKDIRRPIPKKTINNKILMVCCRIVKQSPPSSVKGKLWKTLYLHCSKQIIRKRISYSAHIILTTQINHEDDSLRWRMYSIITRIGKTSNYTIYDFAIIFYPHINILSFHFCLHSFTILPCGLLG